MLGALFDSGAERQPAPSRHPVRLRVWTETPALLGLPWRLTTWSGRWLVDDGWTFEVTTEVVPQFRAILPLPCRILVVAPGHRGMVDIGTDDHLKNLFEVLGAPYQGLWHRARSRRDLAAALPAMCPDVLYYYGHGAIIGGQLCLACGGPDEPRDPLLVAHLRQLMQQHAPKLVYINGCMSGASGWHSAGHQLGPTVPMVVSNP